MARGILHDATRSRLSFHLPKLKDAGVVSVRWDGRWVDCSPGQEGRP